MNYLLLCFSCTLSICFPVQTLRWSLETENDQPIDDFMDKLLNSDKLDQLANIIAEKAVNKLVKIQGSNAANAAKGGPIYRVRKNETNEIEKNSSEHSNNISEEITSLSKNSPFSKLSLKYVKLIEKKRGKQNVKSKTKDKRTTRISAKTNRVRVVKSDRENEQKYTKDSETHVKRGQGKLRQGSVSKPKRNRKKTTTKITTTAHTKVTTDDFSNEKQSQEGNFESNEPTFNTTAVLKSGEDNYYTQIFANSEETTTKEEKSHTQASINAKKDVNLTNVKTKRILARENERLYVFASSSDYDDLYIEDFNR